MAFLKSASDENDILTSVFLFHENNEQGDHWMMEGDRDLIGEGQGKWYRTPSLNRVALVDTYGKMLVGIDYSTWPWKRNSKGKASFMNGEYNYNVRFVQ